MKIIAAYYIEKLHRYCFDVLYQQDYVITFKDRIILKLFDKCQKLFPDYRKILKKEFGGKYNRYSI